MKLVRREGEKKEGESRPLKVVFRKKEDRDRVLANAFNIANSKEEVLIKVSLKADLTKKQRNLEGSKRRQLLQQTWNALRRSSRIREHGK